VGAREAVVFRHSAGPPHPAAGQADALSGVALSAALVNNYAIGIQTDAAIGCL
jgi:hypothetical protein